MSINGYVLALKNKSGTERVVIYKCTMNDNLVSNEPQNYQTAGTYLQINSVPLQWYAGFAVADDTWWVANESIRCMFSLS